MVLAMADSGSKDPALDIIAGAMVRGFRHMEAESAEHQAEFGQRHIKMARIMSFRSTTIAVISNDNTGFVELSDEYTDFGKVNVKRTSDGKSLLLRSRSRRPKLIVPPSSIFDEEPEYLQLVMEYSISQRHLVLSTGSVSMIRNQGQPPILVLREQLTEQGRWPLDLPGGDNTPSPSSPETDANRTFDQGPADEFDDLNDIDIDLEGDAGSS